LPFFSERDAEVPCLLDFVNTHPDITTVLDVGCLGSKYLKGLREMNKTVDGIDIYPSEAEKPFLRDYFVGNVATYPLQLYDLVICLSTIEHIGIKPYRVTDFVAEQNAVFNKLAEVSKRYMYVTFPYGASAFIEGECVVISKERLNGFQALVPKALCNVKFFFNEVIWKFADWRKISQDEADKVLYDSAKGGRCVCILEVIK